MALSFSAGEISYYGLLDYDSGAVCHWDTTVSERLTASIFMVDGGLYIPRK